MKKYKVGIMMAAFAFIAMLPRQTSAAENDVRDAVKLECEAGARAVAVNLTLPSAAGEQISSLQLSLKASGASSAEFEFDSRIKRTAKIYETRYNSATEITNIYIAGTKPLYDKNETTIILGKLNLSAGDGDLVEVEAAHVKLVRGIYAEDLDISDSLELNYGGEPNSENPDPENPSASPSPETPSASPSPETPAVSPSPGTPSVSPSAETPSASPGPATPSVSPNPAQSTVSPQPSVKPVAVPKMPKVTKVSNKKAGIVIKWRKSTGATGYNIYRRMANKSWKRIGTVKGSATVSYTDTTVQKKNGKKYYYTVRAYNASGISSYNKAGTQIVRMRAPAYFKPASNASGKALVKWKRNKAASGYQIQYSTSSKFKKNNKIKKIASGKTTAKTLTKLKKTTTYYVRIRDYKKVNGKTYYSGWSGTKKVKVK